jgi:hypothetical protein
MALADSPLDIFQRSARRARLSVGRLPPVQFILLPVEVHPYYKRPISFRVAKILKDELAGDIGERGNQEQKSEWF